MKTKPADTKGYAVVGYFPQNPSKKHGNGSKHSEEIAKAMVLWMTTGVKVGHLQVLISNTIWKETAQEARKGM